MALRNPSPMPDEPHDPLDPPVDQDEEALGPVPEVMEGLEEAEDEAEGPLPVTGLPEGWEESENEELLPQPDDPDGVSRDMATAALDRGLLQGGVQPTAGSWQPAASSQPPAGPAEWRAMTDAEIMLRVREGDDGGFNFLIEKYRKAIVNFMYRMVHNLSLIHI